MGICPGVYVRWVFVRWVFVLIPFLAAIYELEIKINVEYPRRGSFGDDSRSGRQAET